MQIRVQFADLNFRHSQLSFKATKFNNADILSNYVNFLEYSRLMPMEFLIIQS